MLPPLSWSIPTRVRCRWRLIRQSNGRCPSPGAIVLAEDQLNLFGDKWIELGGRLSRSRPQSSNELGWLIDGAVAAAIAGMLGGVAVKGAQRLRSSQ
jgi:hypothetical protein